MQSNSGKKVGKPYFELVTIHTVQHCFGESFDFCFSCDTQTLFFILISIYIYGICNYYLDIQHSIIPLEKMFRYFKAGNLIKRTLTAIQQTRQMLEPVLAIY